MRKKRGIVRVLQSAALQSAEIIDVAEHAAQLLENLPIARACPIAMGALQLSAQLVLKTIVVEQRIVDVEEKDDIGRGVHGDVTPLAIGPA